MIITENQLKELFLVVDGKTYRPIYTYTDFVLNEVTKEYEYIDFKITKTADEVYTECLANKDKPSIIKPNEMEVLQQQLKQQESAIGLLATQIAKNTLLQNGGMK